MSDMNRVIRTETPLDADAFPRIPTATELARLVALVNAAVRVRHRIELTSPGCRTLKLSPATVLAMVEAASCLKELVAVNEITKLADEYNDGNIEFEVALLDEFAKRAPKAWAAARRLVRGDTTQAEFEARGG